MQPTYLPWIGYFALMDRADVFVFLDSVQFERRSWQQRNRIKSSGGSLMLTVPVINKGLRDQRIADVKINLSSNFVRKHVSAINLAYSKAPFYQQYAPEIFSVLEQNSGQLCDLTVPLILKIKDMLGINCEYIKSSSMDVTGKRADLLADICEKLSANTYISPPGASGYIDKSNAFEEKNIRVLYNMYEHPEYRQPHGEFRSHLSIIDLLFNEGPDSLAIIRKGI